MSRSISVCGAQAAVLFAATACFAQGLPATKPGPEHAALKKMEGTWEAVMSVSGAPKSKGEWIGKMECGGLWLVWDLKNDFFGQVLHTKGLDSYDPVKGKYVSVQIDSLTTFPMHLEGTYDEATRTLTQTGEGRDFHGGAETIKTVTRYIDDDHTTVEVYRVFPDGAEKKHLTIQYMRRKPPPGQE